MPPQPVESRANRLRLPRKPRLGPGSEAGATDGGMQYKANGNRCVNPVAAGGVEARLLGGQFGGTIVSVFGGL